MLELHDGPGVIPGRYEGSSITLHTGPTPQQVAQESDRAAADALAGRIAVAASLSASSECQLLDLIGEFDATGAVRFWRDVKSLAHWLSWSCSMAPGAAREHVRVARALRRMPTVHEAFAGGRLSYSKVRELTRVVDVVDEARLGELALTATASQLARMLSAYRAAQGTRLPQQLKRSVAARTREDGMVEIRALLPAEEGALVVAALDAARDQFGPPPPGPDHDTSAEDSTPRYTRADALLDVARAFLDTAPEDRSGEDRTLVVVQVSADLLTKPAADVPAGTSEDVPAGTPHDVAHVQGVGSVEPETARRAACDCDLLGAVVDAHGDVLALGRTRRLVSRAQRRALMVRDGMCRFPGCHQTRHLQAHHRVPWAAGGPTDLDNLLLLCRCHHTCVHEGGMRIRQRPDGTVRFVMPDGTDHQPWYGAEALPGLLVDQLARQRRADGEALSSVTSFEDDAARSIRPGWAGERFDLAACVDALFTLTRTQADHQTAA